MTDIIDQLSGITPGSALDTARRQRIEARTHAQASYDLLLRPADPGDFPLSERWAVAAFVAALHNQPQAAAHYARGLAPDLAAPIAAEAARAQATGPHGAYPPGPLTRENTPAPSYQPAATLAPHLAAALAYAHMLVFHPRDASPDHLQRLADAGWSTPAIVTLSQLVAFLSFQIRVIAGFRAMLAS